MNKSREVSITYLAMLEVFKTLLASHLKYFMATVNGTVEKYL